MKKVLPLFFYADNGNITSIDGVGTLIYGGGAGVSPYEVTGLTPEPGQPAYRQRAVTYNTFDRPEAIAEGAYTSGLVYDADGDRVKMYVSDTLSGPFVIRYYIGGRYEYDLFSGTERLYLEGDAYSAPMVLIKSGAGGWTPYQIGRDYLGSITDISDLDGQSFQVHYRYDPWGRLVDNSTGVPYAPGSEPTLFLGRGFTSHEYLPWFGLINANARLYDPLLGRFLSPDPYVQDPDFSQNYNRYSYCLNNPLKYTDESGEYIGWDDLIAGLIGGTINWATNGCKFTLEGLSFFLVGAAGGVASLYINPIAASTVMAGLNSILDQGFDDSGHWNGGGINWGQAAFSAALGGMTSWAGGELSSALSNSLGKLTSKIPGKAWAELINRGVTGGVTGLTLGATTTAITTYKNSGEIDWNEVWKNAAASGLMGLTIGSVSGVAKGVSDARSAGENPWALTKDDLSPRTITTEYHSLGAKSKPISLKRVNDKFLKQNGYDAEIEKMNYLGKGAKIGHFDFYLDTNSGQLFIYRKGGIGEGVPTGLFIFKK